MATKEELSYELIKLARKQTQLQLDNQKIQQEISQLNVQIAELEKAESK